MLDWTREGRYTSFLGGGGTKPHKIEKRTQSGESMCVEDSCGMAETAYPGVEGQTLVELRVPSKIVATCYEKQVQAGSRHCQPLAEGRGGG